MNRFLIALQFITRIPIKKELDYNNKDLGSCMLYFPLIGSLLGGSLVLINYLGELYLAPLITNSLLIIGMILLTGGIHLDGLMDTCDGIFSGQNKDRILEIMRDSRVGAFGVIALISVFLLKFSLLVEISNSYKNSVLIYFPTISRWAIVYAALYYPSARKGGLGKTYAQYLKLKHFLLATIWTLAVGIFLFDLQGLIIFLFSWLLTILIIKMIIVKIDGLTGDNYGAINELIEVFSILTMMVVL
ncbi:adenosylcobinamide-GDP ribazoletransferase [Orenia marismortui]|uniref:adenosylcobinamide-GDP ribazoletransferase n=1 Tax=Orenia marismortui TaxID=46469 RepID=UPI00035C46DB|nr:adenosylcobinamide-GDP ribazoletransferase [Orenia marismortui]